MIKTFFTLMLFVLSLSAYTQNYDLSEKNQIIAALNKKTFVVPNYGEIRFKYDGFEYGLLKFEVEYTLYTGRIKKTYDLHTEIPESNGGFHMPDYYKGITLSKKGELGLSKREYPTMFELLENGELYFRDKPKQTFNQYYETTIKKGNIDLLKVNYILCPLK